MAFYSVVQCKKTDRCFYRNGCRLWVDSWLCILQGIGKNLAEFDLRKTTVVLNDSGIFYKRIFLKDNEKSYELIVTFWVYKKLIPKLKYVAV